VRFSKKKADYGLSVGNCALKSPRNSGSSLGAFNTI
jgi:hypothetical protein